MAPRPSGSPASGLPAELGITAGQMRVMTLLMQGKSNKAICRALGLAEPTVKRHVSAILKALNVNNRTEAALAARHASSAPPLDLPKMPSIAVLPFANLSGDPGQDYFADGMAVEISIALGRIPRLFVIASSSVVAYRSRPLDVRKIGAELGVRYVLDGSVRKDFSKKRGRIRITGRLSDASTGQQLWADRFEGHLEDIFALQDRVAATISATIAPALRSAETEQARRKPTDNATAYDLYLRALPPHRDSFVQNQESLRLAYKAIELDPSFGAAYGIAAYCYHMQMVFAWQPLPDDRIREAIRLARLAAEWGESDPEALWMAGKTLAALAGDTDRGLALMGRSTELNPNSARAWWASGLTHAHLGHAEIALDHFSRARRLNPRDAAEHAYWNGIALAHLLSGSYAAAKQAIDMALIDWPNSPPSLRAKAAICGLMGCSEEGRDCVRRILALNPATTLATVAALNRLQIRSNPSGYKNLLEGLRLAGLPEGSA
jgi:TolB-like protein